MIMAGGRRYRAAQLAGLSAIPRWCATTTRWIGIIENLQRENLSPLEEAEGLGALIEPYGYTHEGLAELVGKSRPYVSNTLALRRLPEHIKSAYHERPDVSREIMISVARAETPERQELLWRLATMRKLSVQRFRSEQAGAPGAADEVREMARLVRRLGRKLRALDTAALPDDQRQRLNASCAAGAHHARCRVVAGIVPANYYQEHQDHQEIEGCATPRRRASWCPGVLVGEEFSGSA
jgi:ParB-like chromosome segregation protein Spo0J